MATSPRDRLDSDELVFFGSEGESIAEDRVGHYRDKGLTPKKFGQFFPLSESQSPPASNQDVVDQIAASMDQSPNRSRQSQPRKLCLRHNNSRCIVTGIIVTDAPITGGSVLGPLVTTELAYILPFRSLSRPASSRTIKSHRYGF
ncbi:hypothetical protein M430DRAFT_62105 [Amorphotheca resinae ATCC 22711]|uniref:Uncharacterized protein n=1 Tax=Amorphotheca resinae ATCC 22711 TaxID=857342 RepID=A0A2T3AQ04_AMORE|nr:hypothetical protein M430DRAFT_62105 [Amorphotheca resinae ATCC 22711]PSS07087.1 hypothetical protein M430DRAFT_62105 [Amorphotheca resinae ATCC 22711]